MDEAQKKIVKDVFYGLREIERSTQRLIKKLTALDKMFKGVYQAKPKETKSPIEVAGTSAGGVSPTGEKPVGVDTQNTGK